MVDHKLPRMLLFLICKLWRISDIGQLELKKRLLERNTFWTKSIRLLQDVSSWNARCRCRRGQDITSESISAMSENRKAEQTGSIFSITTYLKCTAVFETSFSVSLPLDATRQMPCCLDHTSTRLSLHLARQTTEWA